MRQALPALFNQKIDFAKTKNIIRTLIAGKESLEQNGKTIALK